MPFARNTSLAACLGLVLAVGGLAAAFALAHHRGDLQRLVYVHFTPGRSQ